jgi:flagellar motor switch protein FliM
MSIADSSLLRISADGQRTRRAAAVLERAAPDLAAALKRALPFFVRRGAEIAVEEVHASPSDEILESLPGPRHQVDLVATVGGARGALVLDGVAVALILDGVLGGDGTRPPTLDEKGLSKAQAALVGRLAKAIVEAFGEVAPPHGVSRFEITQGTGDRPAEGIPLACTFRISEKDPAGGERVARIVLFVAKDAILAVAERTVVAKSGAVDPRVLAAVSEAEIELVAELGRRRVKFALLAGLKPGDLLRLELPLETEARVHVGGKVLFRGRPTSHAGQVGIRVSARHEG